MLLILPLRRQKQAYLYRFEAHLIYIVSSKTAMAMYWDYASKYMKLVIVTG